MRLEGLDVGGSEVTDLSPVHGMPLTKLDLFGTTKLRNLAPLKGMSLEYLNIDRSPVTDLSPLGEMTTLKQLWLDYQPQRDAEALRAIKGLVQINGKPAGEILKAQGK
jgi:internalin A